MSVSRSSFNRRASSAARTRSQCGASEDLVIGRGRFFDAIMLLVSVGFSFTGKNKICSIRWPWYHLLGLRRTFCPVNSSGKSCSVICLIMVNANIPQNFIYPDRILPKFLLHFFWRAAVSGRSEDGTDGARDAPRLMDLNVVLFQHRSTNT